MMNADCILFRIQSTMTIQYNSSRSSSGTFIVFLLALLLGAVGMVIFLRHSTTGVLSRIATAITGRTSTTFDASVPSIVQKIQRLNRLETVVYSLDTVVEGSKSSAVLPDLLAGDRILLIVHGQSIAGIDLSKLRSEDVRIDGQSIRVTLPASELFVTTIDNQRTRVYVRSTGLLTSADQNLESETRAHAQDQLQKDALSDGILDVARKNACATITTLLYGLGFHHVEVM